MTAPESATTNTTDLDQFITTRLPHYIAVRYQRMLQAETPQERIQDALRVFELILRVPATVLVGQYALRDLDKVHDAELNELLRNSLPSPTLSVWKDILFRTLRAYGGVRHLLFVPELYDVYWDTTYEPHRLRADVEAPFDELLRFYNDTYGPHQLLAQKSADELVAIFNQIIARLRAILEQFRFMDKYEVIRVLEETGAGYLYERRTGLVIEPASHPLRTGETLHLNYFYLLNKEDGSTLPLYPMVILWQLQEITIALYDRLLAKNKVEYLLPLSYQYYPHASSDLFHDFVSQVILTIERRQQERREVSRLSWSLLQEVTQALTNRQTATIRQKYDSRLYQPRQKAEVAFHNFLASNKTCFVLVGQSGVGKSNFLLAQLDELIQQRSNICFLFYNGAHLDSTQPLPQTLNESFQNYLEFKDEDLEVLKKIVHIEGMDSRTLLIVIDAVNENAEAKELLKQIDTLIRENKFPWLKLVLTSRPEAWSTMRRGLRLTESKYYQEWGQSQISVELAPFTRQELPQAYERYQQQFRLKTAYEELDAAVRQALRDPLTLRFVAEIYQAQGISKAITVTDISKQFVDHLIETERLDEEDVTFLTTELMPVMFTDEKATNNISYEQLETQGRALLSRIQDDGYMTNGRRINQSYRNLVDAGILIKEGRGINYEISFKYERFYDYFAGRYLLKEYNKSGADNVIFCERLVGHLDQAPFLWGALHNLFISLVEQGEYDLIETLGNTFNAFQADLIISVLSEQYLPYETELKPILRRWLAKDNEAPRITADVAISALIKDILEQILVDSQEAVRLLVVEEIHELWERDPHLTSSLLHTLSQKINRRQVISRELDTFTTLLKASVLLALLDYNKVGVATETMSVVREVWKPVIEKFLFVSRVPVIEGSMKRLRRALVGGILKQAMRFIRQLERERFSFSFTDAETFFPASPVQKQIMERITSHFDAAVGQAPEPVASFTAFLADVARQRESNVIIVYATLLSLIAHLKVDPLRTAQALDQLLDDLEALYPPTEDPTKPTASLWYAFATFPFINISYEEDYAHMSREVLEEVFKVFMKGVRTREFRYRDSWRFSYGGSYRVDPLEELLFGYELNIPEAGREVLQEIIHFNVERSDHDRLKWSFYSIAISMKRSDLADAGVEALCDLINLLQETGYLEQLGEQEREAFWQKASADLIMYAGQYQRQLIDLLDRFEEGQLPDAFKVRIRGAVQKDTLTTNTGEAIAWAMSNASRDKSPFFRNFVKWFFCTTTEVDKIEDLIAELLIFLIDFIYAGESLFSQRDDPCREKLLS